MHSSSHLHEDLVRLFVAVELNGETRKILADEQIRLRQSMGGIKWTPPDMIHLTLVFLGDVFSAQVAGITGILDKEAGITNAFTLEVTGLGSFGSRHCPRIVWAGVGSGAEELNSLQHRIDQGLRALNLSLESRPFHPHFTLGRIKSPREAEGLAHTLAMSATTNYGVVTVNRILLMSSQLLPQGPAYSVLHESALI